MNLNLMINDGNPSHTENIGGSDDQTRFDAGFKSQESPLGPGNTGRSDEDRSVTQELMDDTVPKDNVNDSPLGPGHTGRSDETSMQLIQTLMTTCTRLELKCDTLEEKILGLSTISDAQARKIKRLQRKIKKLRKSRSSTSFKRLKKVGTSQVVSSLDNSVPFEEDASKQGRNEEQSDVMGSGEVNLMRVDDA
jgi:hypothetical protein